MGNIQCVKHGGSLQNRNFYLCADNSIYSGIGRVPICKNCLYEIIESYYKKHKNPRLALYYTCRVMDIAFRDETFEGLYNPGMSSKVILQDYMRYMNSIGVENNARLTFDQGDHIGFGHNKKQEKNKREAKENQIKDPNQGLKMTEEDLKLKEEVVYIVGYDPFLNFAEHDQKALYQDLIGYLDDEEITEDNYLLSQIISVVITNLQLSKINFAISNYMSDPEDMLSYRSEISSLIQSKEKLTKSLNDIAKENNISVKSRGGGAGKSSLTVMAEKLREMGFEKAIENYYTQTRAKGWQRVADISFEAMNDQLKFDENDSAEIIAKQRELVSQAQDDMIKMKEVYRKLQGYKDKLEQLLEEEGVEYEKEHHSIQ